MPLDGFDHAAAVLARIDGVLVGAAALERWGAFGLLRSVVVAEAHRGSNIAAVLVTDRLCAARFDALHAIYLLTTGASGYFERFGFTTVDRTKLPHSLDDSTQIALPACSTAVAMKLQLDPDDAT